MGDDDAAWDARSTSFGAQPDPWIGSHTTVPLFATTNYFLQCTNNGLDASDGVSIIVNLPSQCEDEIDNDSDGFCDFSPAPGICPPLAPNDLPDRGCANLLDNDESDDPACVTGGIDAVCQTWYGENPVNCPVDCLITEIKDL